MKLNLSRGLLEDALFYLEKVVDKKGFVSTAHGAIQFKVNSNQLYLYSSNNSFFCEYHYGPVQESDGNYYVEYKFLQSMVANSTTEEITLNFSERSVIFTDGEGEFSIQYILGADFSDIFSLIDREKEPFLTIDTNDLKIIAPFLNVCLVRTSTIPVIQGAYYDGNFASTDGKAVAVYQYNKKPAENTVLLSPKSLQLLTEISIRTDEVYFKDVLNKEGSKTFYIQSERVTYIVSLLASNFPNYRIALDKKDENEYKIKINRKELVRKCKKLELCTDSKRRYVRMAVSENLLVMRSGIETRTGKETINVITRGVEKEISFNLNISHLVQYLIHLYKDEVVLSIGKSLKNYILLDGTSFYMDSTLY